MTELDIARRSMDAALKATVVPVLRKKGFRGSYPHFYREVGESADLLTFQFRLGGGLFVAEISFVGPNRSNVSIHADSSIAKIRVSMTRERFRLGSLKPHTDFWFDFQKPGVDFGAIARTVAGLLDDQGEAWWLARRSSTAQAK